MKRFRFLVLLLLPMLLLTAFAGQASAHGYRGGFRSHGHANYVTPLSFYYAAPLYVQPLYVQPAPIIVQPLQQPQPVVQPQPLAVQAPPVIVQPLVQQFAGYDYGRAFLNTYHRDVQSFRVDRFRVERHNAPVRVRDVIFRGRR